MGTSQKVSLELRTLNHLIRRRLDGVSALDEINRVTGMHGWAVAFLCEHRDRDIFQRDIEEEFHIRRSTATRIMQLMERNGLITRESVEHDARLKKIVLTEKALAMHRHILDSTGQLEAELTEGLTQSELEGFFVVMNKMKDNMQKKG